MNERSHYLRKEHDQHQCSQDIVKERIRDEGPWRTQIFPRYSDPSRQEAKDYPHQSSWAHSNDSRMV